MKPSAPVTMQDGPRVDDPKLLAWLQASKGKRLRLPVVIEARSKNHLGLGDAFIASSNGLYLELDDGALGIGLEERVREGCPLIDGHCFAWLEGTWGRLIPMPDLGPPPAGPKRWPFAILRVHEMGTHFPKDLTQLHAQTTP